MEFTITIEAEVIDALGADKISAYLNDTATSLRLKTATREAILEEYQEYQKSTGWALINTRILYC